jgi:A/G-specific adenine glycosylase
MQSAMKGQQRSTLRAELLAWYDVNGRDLPWRRTADPYAVWISEIMLQQTRVAAVLDHYRRFLERFPDVVSLARAREQSVLAAWSGLGYYRRARNLHACAKAVVAEHGCTFPSTADALLQLPGIGRYTAAAIASICFREPKAVVDGNVKRVLARMTGNPELSERETWDLAGSLLSHERPGDFNQGIMELGATVCIPREPKCLVCPLIAYCATQGTHPAQKREERVVRNIAVGLAQKGSAVWLVRRSKSLALMPGMWELPEIVANGQARAAELKHSILQTDFRVAVYLVDKTAEGGRWINSSRLPGMALTGLARKVLRHFGLF